MQIKVPWNALTAAHKFSSTSVSTFSWCAQTQTCVIPMISDCTQMRHEHLALRPVTFLGNLSKKCLIEVNDPTASTVVEPINACDDSEVIWPWNEWRLFPFALSNRAGCWLLLIWLLVLTKRELKLDRQHKICTTSGSKMWPKTLLWPKPVFFLMASRGQCSRLQKMLTAA